MIHIHQLTKNEGWFLDLKKKDPITGHTFSDGDTVVVCAKCKTVYLADTWKYKIDGRCASIGCCSDNQDAAETLDELSPATICQVKEKVEPVTFIVLDRTHTNKSPEVVHKQTLWGKIKQFFKGIFGGQG